MNKKTKRLPKGVKDRAIMARKCVKLPWTTPAKIKLMVHNERMPDLDVQ